MPKTRSAGIVLAAGSSKRMGEPKQLLRVRGRPLLECAVAAACASSLDEVLVVLGDHAEEIQARVRLGRARVVINPAPHDGLSTSLRVGVAGVGADVERAMIILGDQPDISADLIDSVLDAHASSSLPAAAVSFDGLLHPPVLLARELWGDLDALHGDVGCRAIIRAHPERVAAVPARGPAGHPVDIDTPEDFARLTADQSGSGSTSSPPP